MFNGIDHCAKSYKFSIMVIYDSRVVPDYEFILSTTLE